MLPGRFFFTLVDQHIAIFTDGQCGDATGMKIKVPSTTEAAGAGAAMLAAKACGKELSSLLCEKTYEPSERAADYDQKYQKFRAIEKRLWKQE